MLTNILLRGRIKNKERLRLGKGKSKYKMICYGTGPASQRNPRNFSVTQGRIKALLRKLYGK